MQKQADEDLTYLELTQTELESVVLSDVTDFSLALLTYLPNLREVRIRKGADFNLSILNECRKLEVVYMDYGSFPVKLPENRSFRVLLSGDF